MDAPAFPISSGERLRERSWICALRFERSSVSNEFYPGQEEVVSRVLAGQDTLAILGDGRRQEPDLSASGSAARRDDRRRQPADRADERSARHAARARHRRRRRAQLDALRRSGIARARADRVGLGQNRLYDAGKTRRRSVPAICCSRSTFRSSSSTKRTASANGDTISGPRISRSAA